jgi:flavodoxin
MKIIYASTSGNVEAVVEKVSEILTAHKISNTLHRAEQTPIDLIKENSQFLFATSTWEHGALNPFFTRLLKEMTELNLTGKSAGFIGLGDTRYEPVYFCQGIKIVKEEFFGKGGSEIYQTLYINGEPYEHLDTTVTDWTNNFISSLHT